MKILSSLPFIFYWPENAAEQYCEFWQLWQDENFFGAHEALEDLWRVTDDEHKLFFNGLIHAAVAIHQHRRGNFIGAARQNVRMQEKLKCYLPQFYGVQVDELMRTVANEIAPSVSQLTEKQHAQLAKLREFLEKSRISAT